MKSPKKDENKSTFIAVGTRKNKFTFVNPLDKTVKVNGLEEEFSFDVDKDGFTYILHKNQRYYIEILEKKQNKFTVLVNGISYTFTVESKRSLQRKEILAKQEPTKKSAILLAPMPGKIIDIFVSEGDVISLNESVLILEAMKMQNEILSDSAGTVTKIFVKKEDTVLKDDALVEITF